MIKNTYSGNVIFLSETWLKEYIRWFSVRDTKLSHIDGSKSYPMVNRRKKRVFPYHSLLSSEKGFNIEIDMNKFLKIISSDSKYAYVELRNVNQSTLNSLHEEISQSNIRYLIKRSILCPYIDLKAMSFIEYQEKYKKVIKKIDYNRRRLEKIGKLEYRIIPVDAHGKYIELLSAMHIAIWKNKEAGSKFSDGRLKEFLKCLSQGAYSEPFSTHLSILSLNNDIIAIHYGFHDGISYYYYIPTYDNKYSKYSPGLILIKYLIEYSYDNKLKSFEFMQGTEEYKFKFTNTTRDLYHIDLYKGVRGYITKSL
jgi:hypothetical protein